MSSGFVEKLTATERKLSGMGNDGGDGMVFPRRGIRKVMTHHVHHATVKSRPAIQNCHTITPFRSDREGNKGKRPFDAERE